MLHTSLTPQALRNHFHYSWWKYVLFIGLSVLFWDLFFTMTAPRTPESEKLEVYVYAYGEQTPFNDCLESIRVSELPEEKEIYSVFMTPDESNGVMVLFTHVAAGEGDIFLLPRDNFQSYAGDGLFVALDEDSELTELCEQAGINLERGWRKNKETGERHLYGIPATQLRGLSDYIYGYENLFLSVRVMNGNDESSMELLKILLRQFRPAESVAGAV